MRSRRSCGLSVTSSCAKSAAWSGSTNCRSLSCWSFSSASPMARTSAGVTMLPPSLVGVAGRPPSAGGQGRFGSGFGHEPGPQHAGIERWSSRGSLGEFGGRRESAS